VDAFVVTSNIIAIDLCSALFVICGFVAGYTHANMAAADWCEFSKIVSLYVLVDLWLSTCATLVLGSIFHLAKHSFRFQVRRVTRFVVCRFVVCRFVVCRFVVCRFVVCRFFVRWRAERRRIIMTMLLFSAAPRAAMFLRCFRD